MPTSDSTSSCVTLPSKKLLTVMKSNTLAAGIIGATLGVAATAGHCQGIPVIDNANLIQTIRQVANDIIEIQNQIQQIQQLRQQLASMNGSRLLGTIADSPALRNYLPPNATGLISAVSYVGYGGLSGTSKALRDAAMIYNCMDLAGAARTSCQASLAQPYQYKGLLQDAMSAASGRIAQITELMRQIDATSDQKSVQEIQARIGAENAMLTHQLSEVQMLQGLAESDERIARARDRERQYEMARRAGRIADQLH